MRYPVEHKRRTRERIIRAAARRFRSRGSEGAAIVDLMRDLHLTHGGFYRHFESKEDLFAEAFERCLQEMAGRMSTAAEQAPRGGELKAIIDTYLDLGHCDHPADGCPFAALAPEIARRPPSVRATFLRALRSFIPQMAQYLPGATEEARRRKAGVLFSGMAGTLAAARIMPDEEQRRRILEDAKKFYLDAARR